MTFNMFLQCCVGRNNLIYPISTCAHGNNRVYTVQFIQDDSSTLPTLATNVGTGR